MIDPAMATNPVRPADALRGAKRDRGNAILGGVSAGLARAFGVEPLLVRVLFVILATFGGLGVPLYLLAWVLMPAEAGSAPRDRRASIEVGVGVGQLLLSILLVFRAAGFWFSDALVWPLVLVSGGAALLWHQSFSGSEAAAATPVEEARRRAAVVSRSGVGAALVIAAGFVFLQATDALSAARDVLLAVIVVAVVLGVIFAPWVVRLARSLAAERSERIRSQERAEMAAHLHDSVLQTLALVQKNAGDEREVAALARRQERELRHWLAGRVSASDMLVAALEEVAADVEQSHGVEVEVVAVGDRRLDERGQALVSAAREAMVNAAKFGGGGSVDVYAEAADGRVHVFVRDRGPGFDPGAVPEDRRGVRESIVGRMERHGGRAEIHSRPGAGTEVELLLESGSS
jgi:signal transduction histidine kinase